MSSSTRSTPSARATTNITTNIIPSITAKNKNRSRRYALCALILLLSAAAFYILGARLIGQIYYHRAKDLLRSKQYQAAVATLEKSARFLPNDATIYKGLGETYFQRGAIYRKSANAWDYSLKSREAYLKAVRLNPLDVESMYGLACVEAVLTELYALYHPGQKDNPYDAAPYFRKTLRLRPNGITYHHAFAHYLYQRQLEGLELYRLVQNLIRIYPLSWQRLTKEPFWSPAIQNAAQDGLKQAIAEEIYPREAHLLLSSLMAAEKKWAKAAGHYRRALEINANTNTTSNYFQLGRLLLKNSQLPEAEAVFMQGLRLNGAAKSDLKGLLRIYADAGQLDRFKEFFKKIEAHFPISADIELALAERLITYRQPDMARDFLEKTGQETENAAVAYQMARIAEAEKDWPQMELHLQKAVVLAPGNLTYRRKLFSLFIKMKQYAAAERELELIIYYSPKPDSRLYEERASLRLRLKKYLGAVQDWEEAIRISPQKAAYHARAAEAYIKLGNWPQAVHYYQNALDLDPGNQNYLKRLKELKGES